MKPWAALKYRSRSGSVAELHILYVIRVASDAAKRAWILLRVRNMMRIRASRKSVEMMRLERTRGAAGPSSAASLKP